MPGLNLDGRDRALWVGLLALCVASAAAYLLWALPAMPETVPVHWGADGAADGWGPKGSTVFMGAVLPLLVLALLFAVPRLDPRGEAFNRFKGVYQGFSAALVVFIVAAGWLTPLTALGAIPSDSSVVSLITFGLMGLLFVGLGVACPRIEPNYTFGIRLPWTLDDPDNWRRTHRFAGPVFVVAGVATVALALFSASLPEAALVAALLVVTLGGVGVVALYSFVIWRRG